MTTSGFASLYAGQFAGRQAVVTGAGSGIGLGVARAFAGAGASVLLIDVNDTVHAAAQVLADAGLSVTSAVADVTEPEQVAACFEGLGTVDVLVNNAGVISIAKFDDSTVVDWRRVIDINLTGQYICCQAAIPFLRKSPHGVILNAASGQARDGFIYTPSYAASKFGVMGMTQSLAKEFASEGIRVNAYCPGIVRTDMWAYNDEHWGKLLGFAPGALIEKWISDIPMGRAADVEDVANLLLFLASDAASYITGQTINIDGGMFMN